MGMWMGYLKLLIFAPHLKIAQLVTDVFIYVVISCINLSLYIYEYKIRRSTYYYISTGLSLKHFLHA